MFDRLFKTYKNFRKGVDSAFEEYWMKENLYDNLFIGVVDVHLKPEEASTIDATQRGELNNLLLEFQDIFETEGPQVRSNISAMGRLFEELHILEKC